MSRRPHPVPVAIAAGVAAGALAFTVPTVAKAAYDARNAHKVDGYHAAQLTKVQYFASDKNYDNFNTCAFTTLMTRTFKAPKKGKIVLTGQVNAARDTSDPNEGLLTVRVLVDGAVATSQGSVNLENDGLMDSSAITIGGAKVAAGKRTLELQAEECGSGMAYITSESLTVTFSPFGSLATPPAERPATGRN